MTQNDHGATKRPTRVFICWSGARSLKLATSLCRFLEQAIVELKGQVFVSTQLAKGVRWFDEIVRELEAANVGIICLTAENLSAPWLHFEAGALAKQLHGRDGSSPVGAERRPGSIFTYLHGVTPANLSGPLSQYQSTSTTRDDTRALVSALVAALGLDGDTEARMNAFDAEWPAFERDTRRIGIMVHDLIPKFERWFTRKTFDEPLQQCTDQNWLARYDGARETRNRLDDNVADVRGACMPYQVDLYEQLRTAMDSYSMTIRGLLLCGQRYPLGASGELEIDAGVLQACERRRKHIKEVVSRMLDPLAVPATARAVTFWLTDSFEQRKMLVHQVQHDVLLEGARRTKQNGEAAAESRPSSNGSTSTRPPTSAVLVDFPAKDELQHLCHTVWDLDRIFGYLCAEFLYPEDGRIVHIIREAAVAELERVRARGSGATLMPFHYALGAIKEALQRGGELAPPEADSVSALCADAREMIEGPRLPKPPSRPELRADGGEHLMDADGKVRRTIAEIEAQLSPRPRVAT